MNNEKIPSLSDKHKEQYTSSEVIHRKTQENINAKNKTEKEASSEASQEQLNKARHEALNQAREIAQERKENKIKTNEVSPEKKRRGPTSKQERKAAFDKTMTEIQSEMSPASRTFSKVIHNPAVEKSSEVIGNTVARPNAILSGSAAAFILTAGIYLVAKHFGYSLSGTETIATFVLGWVIGLIYDYIRVLIFGKSKQLLPTNVILSKLRRYCRCRAYLEYYQQAVVAPKSDHYLQLALSTN